MSYYMGDFYPRGDPGIGSFFGGLVKQAAGFIPGVGPIAQKIFSKVMPGGMPAGTIMNVAGGGITAAAKGAVGRVTTAIVKHPVLSAAGAAGTAAVMGAGAERMMAGAGTACPKGFHPCKSRHGCKKGPCVRNRRMNVCNPRALRRSIRRARGFTKLAMKTIHIVHPKKKGRFGGFKRRRKS